MGMRQQLTRCMRLLGVLLASGLVTTSLATAVDVGERAPDFTLPSTTGGMISLSQFRGQKLVLLEFHLNDFGVT
jgi:peroxiredoxin